MKRLDRLLFVGRKRPAVTPIASRNLPLLVFLLFLLFLLAPRPVIASTIGEEFDTTQEFVTGSLISFNPDNPEQIALSTIQNSEYLLGAVSDNAENVVTYAKDDSDVTVAISGQVTVFVTDANGLIQKGDFIGTSWLEGIGMKAITSDRQKLLGIALADFELSEAEQYGEIETDDGKREVSVTSLPVRLFDKEGVQVVANATDSGLQSFLSDLAGREVSFVKVIAGSIIFLVSALVAGFFVSASIRGSFVSIGRNPMASASIYRSLFHVTMVSVSIILIGTALTYVVLVV